MTMSIESIAQRVEALKHKQRMRDVRAQQVREVRHGNFDAVAPDLFSNEWPRPIVANRIDTMARHASAALSPLPTFSCNSVTTTSDRARDFADKRTKIVNHYAKRSRLQAQMQTGADQFYTYGLLVTSVEPDAESKFPHIYVEDSIGVYPAWNRHGRTVEVAMVRNVSVIDLCTQYPEHEGLIRQKVTGSYLLPLPLDKQVEFVRYVSDKRIIMYVPEMDNLVLDDMENPVGRCTIVCTQKPGLDSEIRGSFDDLIWVQLALHAMQTYTLAAAAEAVQAPYAVPMDVTDVPYGPGAIIRSNTPGDIRRVAADVPQSAFASSAYLSSELDQGAIVPEALGGSIDASVVTGKGVQQLMAGYSQQIANCQQSLVGHFEQVLELCLMMDEKFWPDESKHIIGRIEATPYDATYRPARDINGDYTVEVQYGGIAGLDPNRGLVFLLQAQGAGLVSRDYVRRNLPSGMNPKDEEAKIAVESLRESLLASVAAMAQALPEMVAQGADPQPIVSKMGQALMLVQKGHSIEDALSKMFPEPEPEPAPAAEGMAPQEPPIPGAMPGAAPGTAVEQAQGRPSLEMLFAGLTSSGNPNLQAGVSRQREV